MKEPVQKTSELEGSSIDDLVDKELSVLDHGFVRLVDYMGSDAAIVQAARVSYGTGTKQLSEDRGLIRYLMRHRHTTPFEMCEIKFHVKLPIFVARQWVRHRTANINEYSARYSILDKEFYVPDRISLSQHKREVREANKLNKALADGQDDFFGLPEREQQRLTASGPQSQTNKQGRDSAKNESEILEHLKTISGISNRTYSAYERLLNQTPDGDLLNPEYEGLARELARMVLPTNYYTQWYWKIDLHNLFHFVSLRADGHAQYEIREYARVISEIVSRWVPFAWEAFEDYRQNNVTLSRLEAALLKRLLNGDKCEFATSGLSKREWREFLQKFELRLPDA